MSNVDPRKEHYLVVFEDYGLNNQLQFKGCYSKIGLEFKFWHDHDKWQLTKSLIVGSKEFCYHNVLPFSKK